MKTQNTIVTLSLFLFFFASCTKDIEHARASDFQIDWKMVDKRWKSQYVEGTIANLSSTPAKKIKIRVDMYECDRRVDHRIITIREDLFQNESCYFKKTVGDTITGLDIYIVDVK